MLSPAKNLFVSIPTGSGEQILHPGTVISVEDKIYTVQLEEENLLTKAGQEVLIYYEVERTFMQELAWIENVLQDDPKAAISLGTSGKPICAESRACYRVPVATKNLSANVGLEKGCKLLEVSQAGFAIIASHSLPKGKLIEVNGQKVFIRGGNWIGTDATGTADLGNAFDGVVIEGGSGNNTVGGTSPTS